MAQQPHSFVQPDEIDISRETGAGVRVAIVDSGVDRTHPAIDGRVAGGAVVERWQDYLVVGDYDGEDCFGHGTACAGIVLEIAPDVELYSVRVLGSQLSSKSEIIIHGVRWALEQGYDVVNCSFGTTNFQYLPEYKELVDLAYTSNVLMTVACNNDHYSIRELPSAFASIVAVDFLRKPIEDPLQFFRRDGDLIEFVGRGYDVRVPWLDHGYISTCGSSFAAPQLAGIICRLRQKYPQLRPFELKTLLHQMAQPVQSAH